MGNSWLTFKELQKEVLEWKERNFQGTDKPHLYAFLGLVEEVGELSHSLLKSHQGIRGTWEEHREKAVDAVGDIVIYLADFCNEYALDLQYVVEKTWGKVKKRDWKKDPLQGGERETG